MDHALVLVRDRNDAATGLHLRVRAEPLSACDLMEEVPQWSVAGHAGGLGEHDLPDINRKVRVSVDVLNQFGDV